MSKETSQALQIQKITGLKPKHFADLIRAAQIVFDPTGGVSRRVMKVDWQSLGIPYNVAENLKLLGRQYRYSSPYLPIETVWEQLTPETRSWFIENRKDLWRLEEAFPAIDED